MFQPCTKCMADVRDQQGRNAAAWVHPDSESCPAEVGLHKHTCSYVQHRSMRWAGAACLAAMLWPACSLAKLLPPGRKCIRKTHVERTHPVPAAPYLCDNTSCWALLALSEPMTRGSNECRHSVMEMLPAQRKDCTKPFLQWDGASLKCLYLPNNDRAAVCTTHSSQLNAGLNESKLKALLTASARGCFRWVWGLKIKD